MKHIFLFMYIYIYLCVKIKCADYDDINEKLNKYLLEQSEIDQLIRDDHKIKKKEITGDFSLESLGDFNLTGFKGIVNTFKLFETTYITTETHLYYIAEKNNSLVLETHSNTTDFNTPATFLTTQEFRDSGFVIIGAVGDTKILLYSNNTFTHILSIVDENIADAKMFINGGKLYLVTINVVDSHQLSSLTLYKWTTNTFNLVDTQCTIGAKKLHTFTFNEQEVIIVLRRLPSKKISSQVFMYTNKELHISKFKLNTDNPIGVTTYTLKKIVYIVIWENSKHNQLYLYFGTKFFHWDGFKSDHKIKSAEVFYMQSTSAVLLYSKERMLSALTPYAHTLKSLVIKEYSSRFTKILAVNKGRYQNETVAFIIGLKAANLSINVITFKTHLNPSEMDSRLRENDALELCFINLEQKVKSDLEKLNYLTEKTGIFRRNQTIPLNVRSSILGQSQENIPPLELVRDSMVKLQRQMDVIKATIPEDNTMIIDGPVLAKTSLSSQELTAKNLKIRNLNEEKFVPEQWLMYSEPQTITGPVTLKTLITKNFQPSPDDNNFNNLLLATGNQNISGDLRVNNLITDRLYTNQINDVPFDQIYLKSKPQKITGVKTFGNLQVDDAKIQTINNRNANDLLAGLTSKTTFPPEVFVENLTVEEINGVHWDNFSKSLFKIGTTTTINGDLTFSKLKTRNLNMQSLQGIPFEDFVTTSTDQTIHSNVKFNKIQANNIETSSVNGINLKKEAAFINEPFTISGPVTIDTLKTEDLELMGEFDQSRLLKKGSHIVGTNPSDLLQIYDGKVLVKGNVFITNVTLDPTVKLVVDNEEYPHDVSEEFWTKSTHQDIPVHFEAQNGMTTPHLITNRINGVDLNDFMLITNDFTAPTIYYFDNVTISGHVLLDQNTTQIPNLNKLDREAVKTNGSFVINGMKTYNGTLRVRNFITNSLGGINVFDTVTKNFSGNVTGTKYFKNLIIKGDMSSNLSVKVVNNKNLEELQNNTVYIDRNQTLDVLNLDKVIATNISLRRINGHYLDDYILKLDEMHSIESINDVYVNGNVIINKGNVSRINNVPIENLLNAVSYANGTIPASAKFSGTTTIESLYVVAVNDANFEELTSRFLYRDIDQIVTGHYTFQNLKTENLNMAKFNNRSMEELIDVTRTDPQELHCPGGLIFTSSVRTTSIESKEVAPCDLAKAYNKMRYIEERQWDQVIVADNATFMDSEGDIARIFDRGVTLDTPQTITAPIEFKTLITGNITSNKLVNNVNLTDLMKDALLKNSHEEQLVTGRNIFPQFHASQVKVEGNADIPVVNKIYVSELDKAIIDKDKISNMVITGKKTFFSGIECKRFYSEVISGVKPEDIVSLDNLKTIPDAIFDTVDVTGDININYVNGIDFKDVMDQRLLCHGDEQIANGTYFFENINVRNNLETPLINEMRTNDIVFDVDEQVITGSKRFTSELNILGDMKVDLLNGDQISKMYAKSIISGEPAEIEGSMTFLRPTTVDGNIIAETINGYPTAKIKEILTQRTINIPTEEIHRLIDEISINIRRSFERKSSVLPKEYMYIEKSSVLQIALPNTNGGQAMVETGGQVLLHITGEEFGPTCGLPDTCHCPVQHTIQISPEHSVNDFINKATQRIFSFNDTDMIVHLITNSISSGENCRANQTEAQWEISYMTWNTVGKNGSGRFYMYPEQFSGYVSGVEFFASDGFSYVVIGRFYDPVENTYDLNCVVLKFKSDKSKVEEIQTIPTRGVNLLKVFPTAHGVYLILVNKWADTEIYKFNGSKDKFEIWRTLQIPECTSVTGISLPTDTFLALAIKNNLINELNILKYDKYFENFYPFQGFQLDEPIVGLSVLQTNELDDTYICAVSDNQLFIYAYKFLEGWKIVTRAELEGLRNVVPIQLADQTYLFAPSTGNSSLLTVVKQGYN